ncbi:MAG: glycosyltransferase [Chloroflexi bacterium]|nr:glycosyltransferase [Chloroflexota bacterium]
MFYEESKMSKKPIVSVVMPVYNGEKYLSEAIESILTQTFHQFEFIIIDDGSIDGTGSILLEYAKKDPRIKVICQKNQGIVSALNNGIANSQGKYIARMDADDISLPRRFQQQVNFLDRHPEIGVVGSAYLPIDEQNNQIMSPTYRPEYPLTVKWFMLIGSPVAHPSTMYRVNLARQVGGYDKHFTHAEDYEFWIRMAEITDICSIKDVLILYRVSNQDRISIKYLPEQLLVTNKIRQIAYSCLFNAQMTPAISAAIQGSGGTFTNQNRYNACFLLFKAFKSLSENARVLNEKEKQELEETARENIFSIASRITNTYYMVKIFFFPLLFSRNQYLRMMAIRLINWIKRKTKSLVQPNLVK